MSRIIFSPSKYIQGEGELKKLKNYTDTFSKLGVYILLDKFVYDNYKDVIEHSFKGGDTPYHMEVFNGECSKQEVNRNIDILKSKNFDMVVAIGGGKTIDTGKAIGFYLNLPIVVAPTIASTDAPCSALSVLYTENGEFDEYLFLKANPNIVLMDTEIIAKAPTRLLVSGIGDALATYYEAQACYDCEATTIAGGKPSQSALALAKLCIETLFADGYKAKIANENGIVNKAFENIVEANTYLSGIGFESGGLAAAHAIHNGLTILEEGHNKYHGEKVSFGTIVQLVLENRSLEEIEDVIAFCKSLGLPTCLKDLGMDKVSKERLFEVAKQSCVEGETIHNMPFEVNAESVYAAIITADKLGA